MKILRPKTPDKPLLRYDEVAGILRCSDRTVYRLVREHKLHRPRPGFISKGSLDTLLKGDHQSDS